MLKQFYKNIIKITVFELCGIILILFCTKLTQKSIQIKKKKIYIKLLYRLYYKYFKT